MPEKVQDLEALDEVDQIFGYLLEEVDAAVERTAKAGQEQLAARDFDAVLQHTERARALEAFADSAKALRQRWQREFGVGAVAPPANIRSRRSARAMTPQSRVRAPLDMLTPAVDYRDPLLDELTKRGGKASSLEIEHAVYLRMRTLLTQRDLQPTSYRASLPRWKDRLQFCRQKLVEEGLMRNDSPRGEWEISKKGREWLASVK